MWWFGFGREEITTFEEGMSMWGWGSPDNIPTAAAMPLHARALVLRDGEGGRPYCYVCLELGMVSESVRRETLRSLHARGIMLAEHDLTLTATHTHSGPSGFSTYLLYALAGPGFSRAVHDHIVAGIVKAIAHAFQRCAPGRVRWIADDIPLSKPVAWNRAIAAYNRNEDTEPVDELHGDAAVDRSMTALCFEDESGRPRGMLTWFGVHCTSVHHEGHLLHPDNKGVAAARSEALAVEHGFGADFVAIFAQEAAGDVTPNYRWIDRRKLMAGRYDDDHESADFNGSIQARQAFSLLRRARDEGEEIAGPLDAALRYRDFSSIEVDPAFARGHEGCRTTSAQLGVGFSLGTSEGPGPLYGTQWLSRLARLQGFRVARGGEGAELAMQGRKFPLFHLGHGIRDRMLGLLHQRHPLLSLLPDRRVRYYLSALETRGARTLPWVPYHLPFQLVRLGPLLLATVPFEPTTVAGRRIRAMLAAETRPLGIRKVVLNSYANAYVGYLSTFEEYQHQGYEANVTLFGQWSHGACCTELRRLARALGSGHGRDDTGNPPPYLPLEEWLPPPPSGGAGRRGRRGDD